MNVRGYFSSIKQMARNTLFGPEKTFTVQLIEIGKDYKERYLSVMPSWGGAGSGIFYNTRRLRPVTVQLAIDGLMCTIRTIENIESTYEGSGIMLFPYEVGALQQLFGQSIIIRARSPYNSETLKKLAKIYQPRGESR